MSAPRRHMKLRHGVSATVQRPGQEYAPAPFAPYVPAPGVAPASALAMDSAEQTVYAWATQASIAYGEGQAFLGYPYLTQLAQRPEFRQISSIWAKEMTRRWIKVTSAGGEADEQKIKAIEEVMRKLRVRNAFRDATMLDGFFGRAHIFIDLGPTKPGELETPLTLDPRKIRRGSLRGFRVVEPAWVYPNAYNTADPLDENYYRPRDWFVMGNRVNRTRLMTLVSQPVPDLLKPSYSFGGLSRTQQAMPYVDNWIRTRESVSNLLHSFSKTILKTNMAAVLSGGGADALIERAKLYAATRDNRDLIMVDMTDEDIVDVSTPLGSLDALQAQSQEQMASIAGIPLVVLLGITPSGLNASSDGEIKTFYAAVKAAQEDLFTDPLNVVLSVIQLSLFGAVDPDIGFEYLPLWEDDDTARAAIQKTKSEIDTTYIDAGVISPEEVRERLANDPASPYAGLDLSDPPPQPPEPDVPDDAEEDGPPAQDAEFRESDHPRADNGQFGEGAGTTEQSEPEEGKSTVAVTLKKKRANNFEIESNGARVGHVTVNPHGDAFFIDRIELDPKFQGQRIGSTTYNALEKGLGATLVPSPLGLSDSATALWKKRLAKMDAEKATALLDRAWGIGKGYGLKDEHLQNRLGPLVSGYAGPAARQAQDAEWDESKHKRADNGQFGSGGGGSSKGKPKRDPAPAASEETPEATAAREAAEKAEKKRIEAERRAKVREAHAGPGFDRTDAYIDPADFNAADFARLHDKFDVTEADIINGFPDDTSERIKDVESRIAARAPTNHEHKQADGSWTPERQALHKSIIDEFFTREKVDAARPADGKAPTFTVLGGRGGSGKSWFEGHVYDPGRAIVLDPDHIKAKLPEFEGWNAAQVHEESSEIADEITRIAQENGLNLVHDATMKSPDKAKALVQGFKDRGYRVEAHYMHLPRQEAAKRAVGRFLNPESGRYVPPSIVLGNTENEKSFEGVKDLVDAWSFRDNNVPKDTPPILISESRP